MLEGVRRQVAELRKRRRFKDHEAVGRRLYERYGLTVRHGPFEGLTLPDGAAKRLRALGPRLLGTYEDVLQPFVEAAVDDTFASVVNVGAADGYFAVGLARRMPSAHVLAYEMEPEMRDQLADAARRNGVADRVDVRGTCTVATLAADLQGRALLVVDCEGAELELLDPAAVPALRESAAVVELHDFVDPSISRTLVERFAPTHDTALVSEPAGERHEPPELRELSAEERRLAVDELRPASMSWLVAAPRAEQGPFAAAVRAHA